MSNQNKGNEARADVAMPLTREGLFAYFDQMSDKDGRINTTAQWLADVGMLIVHDTNKAHHATANADLAAALAFEAGQRAKALEIAEKMDNRMEVIEAAKVFPPTQDVIGDAGWIEMTMADFAIKRAADDRAAFIATLRERVEVMPRTRRRENSVWLSDIRVILDEMEAEL